MAHRVSLAVLRYFPVTRSTVLINRVQIVLDRRLGSEVMFLRARNILCRPIRVRDVSVTTGAHVASYSGTLLHPR
jgi:hypothetical protein